MSKTQEIIKAAEATSEYWAEVAKLDFACLLNNKMESQKMSRTKLAKEIGVSKAYISEVLSGDLPNFTIDTMAKFMFAFGERISITSEPIKIHHLDLGNLLLSSVKGDFQQPSYTEIINLEVIPTTHKILLMGSVAA